MVIENYKINEFIKLCCFVVDGVQVLSFCMQNNETKVLSKQFRGLSGWLFYLNGEESLGNEVVLV